MVCGRIVKVKRLNWVRGWKQRGGKERREVVGRVQRVRDVARREDREQTLRQGLLREAVLRECVFVKQA